MRNRQSEQSNHRCQIEDAVHAEVEWREEIHTAQTSKGRSKDVLTGHLYILRTFSKCTRSYAIWIYAAWGREFL